MNLNPLFIMQDQLDEKVGSRLSDYDMRSHYAFDDRRFAFYNEIHEWANVIGFFKYWKQDHHVDRARAMDEGVDCVHFLLSIGLMKGYNRITTDLPMPDLKMYSFGELFDMIHTNDLRNHKMWEHAFSLVLAVFDKLGYSEKDVILGYDAKWHVNMIRQSEGY